MANRLDISDQTAISMPMRNLISIVAAVAVGVWAYFGVLERITMLETKSTLAEKDLPVWCLLILYSGQECSFISISFIRINPCRFI